MENKEIIKKIEKAITRLGKEERQLRAGSSERSFAHRLAVHMETLFDGWDIDCEYNRQGISPKELKGLHECDGQERTGRIFPDIIIHYRANDSQSTKAENLLVIEIKNNNLKDLCDEMKLKLFTAPKEGHEYQLGLYLNRTNRGELKKTWYEGGKSVPEKEIISRKT